MYVRAASTGAGILLLLAVFVSGEGVLIHSSHSWPPSAGLSPTWICSEAGFAVCEPYSAPFLSSSWYRGGSDRYATVCSFPRGRAVRLSLDDTGVLLANGLTCQSNADDCRSVLEATRAVLMSETLETLGVPVARVLAAYTLDGPAVSTEDHAVIISKSSCDLHLGMIVEAALHSKEAAVEWMASAARLCLPELRESFADGYSVSPRTGTDDDDDEEDDDEFFYAYHADDFVLAVARRMTKTYLQLRDAGLDASILELDTIAIDGTVLQPGLITTNGGKEPCMSCDSRDGRPRSKPIDYFEMFYSLLDIPDRSIKKRLGDVISDLHQSSIRGKLLSLGLPSGSKSDVDELVTKLAGMNVFSVDMVRLARLLSIVRRREPNVSKDECSADEDVRMAFNTKEGVNMSKKQFQKTVDHILEHYRAAKRMELATDEDLAAVMDSLNPNFIAREWAVRKAALSLVEGDSSELERQLAWTRDMFHCRVPHEYLLAKSNSQNRIPCSPKQKPVPLTSECASVPYSSLLDLSQLPPLE